MSSPRITAAGTGVHRALVGAAIAAVVGGGCYDGLGDDFQPPAGETGAAGSDESGGDESGSDEGGSTGGVDPSADGEESGESTAAPAETGESGGPSPLSYQVDIYEPLFKEACGCHVPSANNYVDLTGGAAALVNVLSTAVNPGATLVKPFDPANSFLVAKLRGGEAIQGLGQPMPYSFRLDEEEIARVEQWIRDGALP